MTSLYMLDLFCGAGGAAEGYYRAAIKRGIDLKIVGIDNRPQPHYPFEFIQDDAIDFLISNYKHFDLFHASPPCQVHSQLAAMHKNNPAYLKRHYDYIPLTRSLLVDIGKTYVIENVPGSTLKNFVVLCGKSFGLKVYRHRWFESNRLILAPSHEKHHDKTPSAGHGISPKGFISVAGNGGMVKQYRTGGRFNSHLNADGFITVVGHFSYFDYAKMAMGIDWMSRAELSQAIPPAYTEHIFQFLLDK